MVVTFDARLAEAFVSHHPVEIEALLASTPL